MKKILILTAERTGTGHKSAANAIEKKLINLGFETKQIDCFEMIRGIGMLLENSYIPLTTTCPLLFQLPYKFSQTFPDIIHNLIYINSKKRFKREIEEFKPDLIITVHSMFTKAISHLLKKEHIDIPFYVDVIDLVNPPNVWFDKNADITFVPTNEVKKDYIKKGIEKNKLIVSGFPIRSDIQVRQSPKTIDDKINILLANPSVYLRKNIKYVKEVSRLDNVNVTVVCGRDKKMYKALIKEQNLGKISKDVRIYSFISNMNELLENSHILLTKAGPNMILEGIRSGTAVVVTGHIKGQEDNNYQYVVKNNFGFKCENPDEIYDELNEFISSSKLNDCLKNVLNSDCTNGDEIISDYIFNHINDMQKQGIV